nr:immunoglobulin light chain junction region [Macaca mulatta]MOW40091.1 immunoglobulin light chain junction region [Macaca mulatta]MOW40130.1 immunoglobulin light chain junction region [Macaca mulatta]MOW40419.1 immunoglobulin light chain junction region [Macaca mulatta]
CCQYFSGYTF